MAKKRINKITNGENEKLNLSPKELKFCHEYVKDLNGYQAAIRAGYSSGGARVRASILLTNENVCTKIRQLNNESLSSVKIDAETVLSELLKIATSDIRCLFDEKGAILKPDLWPDNIARCVSSIQVEELEEYIDGQKTFVGYTKKIKLWDKNRALEKLAKHLGLLIDKIEHSGKVTLEDLVTKSFADGS